MRWVVLYLTAGACFVFGLTAFAVLGAPGVVDRLRDKYLELDARGRRTFLFKEFGWPIATWPIQIAALVALWLSPRHRERFMDHWRRTYLDDERVRRALEPQYPEVATMTSCHHEPAPAGSVCGMPTQAGFEDFWHNRPNYERCGAPAAVKATMVVHNAPDFVMLYCAEHHPALLIDAEFDESGPET